MTAHAGSKLHLRRAHADVAQVRQTVDYALLVLTLGPNTVRVDQPNCQHAGVVVLLQLVPADVFADLDIALDLDAYLHQALDLAIQNVRWKHPHRNAAAIQAAGLGRLFQDRHLVAESRQLIRRAVSRRTRADNRNLLAVRLAGLHDVVGQRLTEIAEKALDRANGNRLVILSAIAGLLTRVIAHAAGHGREGHVFLDQRIGVEILAALHQIEVALNLLVGAASVVARWQLVAVDRPNRSPVAGGEQVLPFFLCRCGSDAGERDLEPVGNVSAFGRHSVPS